MRASGPSNAAVTHRKAAVRRRRPRRQGGLAVTIFGVSFILVAVAPFVLVTFSPHWTARSVLESSLVSEILTSSLHRFDPDPEQVFTIPKDGRVPYDMIVRDLESTPSFRGVVHNFPSIPSGRQTPPSQVQNLTHFLISRERPEENDRPLYLYNPMVLPLYSNKGEILSGSTLDAITGKCGPSEAPDADRIKYVAVHRISNFANCFGPGRGVPENFTNYLGLALLDSDLGIVPGTDVVIDINEEYSRYQLTKYNYCKCWDKRTGRATQAMQDCQLIAAMGGTDAKVLYLVCNEYIVPVSLHRPPCHASNLSGKTHLVNNTYGDGLRLAIHGRREEFAHGEKNFHFFATNEEDRSRGLFLESWPSGPHETKFIEDLSSPKVETAVTWKGSLAEPRPSFNMSDNEEDVLTSRDSGSACCVQASMDGSDVLLGFSHRKTAKGRQIKKKFKYSYVSRLYAFDPHPPFNIIARSGFFCLGFADPKSEGHMNEQVGANVEYHLVFPIGSFVDCPRIHFITGIADKVGDDSKVIISYGVNDCYPRMIEVSKDYLVTLLRPAK